MSDILDYSETLPDAEDLYHIVRNNNLYLLFGVASSTISEPHRTIIKNKVVPFITRATKHFGPGEYNLHVFGAASSTNKSGRNDDLAAARAYNAAMAAIRQFEADQKKDPDLDGITINPNVINVSDTYSTQEAKLLKLKPNQVEKSQATHRAAMFKFNSKFQHGTSGSIFQIREIYAFKAVEKQLPLPDALEELRKDINSKIDEAGPLARVIFDKAGDMLIEKIIKTLKYIDLDNIPPQYKPLIWMFKYILPTDVERRYEIKDYRSVLATYRLAGEGHKFELGVASLLGWISKLFKTVKVLKVLATASSKLPELKKYADALDEQLQRAISIYLRAVPQMAPIIGWIESASDTVAPTVTVSDWTPFKFYDNSPDWDVRKLGGMARLTGGVTVAGYGIYTLQFGTPKSRNIWAYAAEVDIKKPWSLTNGLLGVDAASFCKMQLIGTNSSVM